MNVHVKDVRWLNHCETGAGHSQFGFRSPEDDPRRVNDRVNGGQNSFLVQRTCWSCDMLFSLFALLSN
jgi:hypothetical protein